MEQNMDKVREQIYEVIFGDRMPEEHMVLGFGPIQNEFEDGSVCAAAYARMLGAYSRVCQRLGTEEWADPDVEIIVNELLEIGKLLGYRMFEYGALAAKHGRV